VYDVELERMARRQFGIATPDPRNEAYFGTDFAAYPAMSTLRNIDAPETPILITYAELDPVQMQVQAGALFVALCNRAGRCPEIGVIRKHSHISQSYSINTGDMSLAGPILDFVKARP
jgi:triacylglycerol lipase